MTFSSILNGQISIYMYSAFSPSARREQNGMHVAEVPLIDKETCSNIDDYKTQVSDNMICAGLNTGGVDTCLVSCHRFQISRLINI